MTLSTSPDKPTSPPSSSNPSLSSPHPSSSSPSNFTASHSKEKLFGVVERVVFYNEENGWSVLRVNPFSLSRKARQLQREQRVLSFNVSGERPTYGRNSPLVTVVAYQARAFAGASMEFDGDWIQHKKYGLQFKAQQVVERKPASCAALEKYLGSGLIKGVGPKTAKRIVDYFGEETLEVFESQIERLLKVPGIALKKLKHIHCSWQDHKAVRDVIMFLQQYDVSTLFAVKIFKTYGSKAISIVSKNPYRLAEDIYGIGFFSADKIALKMGLSKESPERIGAAIFHVLSSGRDDGHCYLNGPQVVEKVQALLEMSDPQIILKGLKEQVQGGRIKHRPSISSPFLPPSSQQPFQGFQDFPDPQGSQNPESSQGSKRSQDLQNPQETGCFYIPSIYWDEELVGKKILEWCSQKVEVNTSKVKALLSKTDTTLLSSEQEAALLGIVENAFSVLTGGPGCGKTTSTHALVQVLRRLGKKLLLAAPTGRAAQRMGELIGNRLKPCIACSNGTP